MDSPNKASMLDSSYNRACLCVRCERQRTQIQNSNCETAKVTSGRSEEAAPAEKFTNGGFDDTPNEKFGAFPDMDLVDVQEQNDWWGRGTWSALDAGFVDYAKQDPNLMSASTKSATTPKPDEDSTAVEGAVGPSLDHDAFGAPEFLTNWTRYASPQVTPVEYSNPEQNPLEEDFAPMVDPQLASAGVSTDKSLSTTLKNAESVDPLADEISRLIMPSSNEILGSLMATDELRVASLAFDGIYGPWIASEEGRAYMSAFNGVGRLWMVSEKGRAALSSCDRVTSRSLASEEGRAAFTSFVCNAWLPWLVSEEGRAVDSSLHTAFGPWYATDEGRVYKSFLVGLFRSGQSNESRDAASSAIIPKVVETPPAGCGTDVEVSSSATRTDEYCPTTVTTEENSGSLDDICDDIKCCWCDKPPRSGDVSDSLPTDSSSDEDKMAEHLRLFDDYLGNLDCGATVKMAEHLHLFDDYFDELDCDATQMEPIKTGAESKC